MLSGLGGRSIAVEYIPQYLPRALLVRIHDDVLATISQLSIAGIEGEVRLFDDCVGLVGAVGGEHVDELLLDAMDAACCHVLECGSDGLSAHLQRRAYKQSHSRSNSSSSEYNYEHGAVSDRLVYGSDLVAV